MKLITRLAYYLFRTEVLKQTGYLQTALKILSYADETEVEISYAKRPQGFFSAAVCNLGIYNIRHYIVNFFLIDIYSHYFITELVELSGNVLSETSESDNKN